MKLSLSYLYLLPPKLPTLLYENNFRNRYDVVRENIDIKDSESDAISISNMINNVRVSILLSIIFSTNIIIIVDFLLKEPPRIPYQNNFGIDL